MYSVQLLLHMNNSYRPTAFLITELEKKQVRHIPMEIYYQPSLYPGRCFQLRIKRCHCVGDLLPQTVIANGRTWKVLLFPLPPFLPSLLSPSPLPPTSSSSFKKCNQVYRDKTRLRGETFWGWEKSWATSGQVQKAWSSDYLLDLKFGPQFPNLWNGRLD